MYEGKLGQGAILHCAIEDQVAASLALAAHNLKTARSRNRSLMSACETNGFQRNPFAIE